MALGPLRGTNPQAGRTATHTPTDGRACYCLQAATLTSVVAPDHDRLRHAFVDEPEVTNYLIYCALKKLRLYELKVSLISLNSNDSMRSRELKKRCDASFEN